MTDKTAVCDSLAACVAKLADSAVVMSRSQVEYLLRYIANTPALWNIVSEANECAVAEKELEKCLESGSFVLPQDSLKIVGVVTYLLFKFRNSKDYQSEFISSRFKRGNYFESLDAFVGEVMTSYVAAFRAILLDEKVIEDDGTAAARGATRRNVKYDVNPALITVYNRVMADDSYSAKEKEDVSCVIEAFVYAADIGNSLLIKALFIALKKHVGTDKLLAGQIKIIGDILLDNCIY